MYTLKNWCLGKAMDGGLYAHGTVFGHHRLSDGDSIYTSKIEKIYLRAKGEYVMETHSGSLYHLLAEEMSPKEEKETKEKLATFEFADGTEMMQELAEAEAVLNEKKKMIDNCEETARMHMDEDGLYLIMEYMHVVKAIFKKGEKYREIFAYVHVGMFQDSVLLTDWEEGEVDFRYFPNSMMEPYHWSDGLANIYIHNVGRRNIVFEGTKRNIECKANEVTKISKCEYRGEGLFSPDAVNGKCLFSGGLSDSDELDNEDKITQEEINKLLGGE